MRPSACAKISSRGAVLRAYLTGAAAPAEEAALLSALRSVRFEACDVAVHLHGLSAHRIEKGAVQRGTHDQRGVSVGGLSDRSSDDMPTLTARLVAEAGASITGGAAQVGRVALAAVIRS